MGFAMSIPHVADCQDAAAADQAEYLQCTLDNSNSYLLRTGRERTDHNLDEDDCFSFCTIAHNWF